MSRPVDEVTKRLQDAAYVAVGLGVLAFQRAQVRRQELRRNVARLGSVAEEQALLVEERLEGAEEQLPEPLAAIARTARLTLHEASALVRSGAGDRAG